MKMPQPLVVPGSTLDHLGRTLCRAATVFAIASLAAFGTLASHQTAVEAIVA